MLPCYLLIEPNKLNTLVRQHGKSALTLLYSTKKNNTSVSKAIHSTSSNGIKVSELNKKMPPVLKCLFGHTKRSHFWYSDVKDF